MSLTILGQRQFRAAQDVRSTEEILRGLSTFQSFQESAATASEGTVVVTEADRITFAGFFATEAAGVGESMNVDLIRVRAGVATTLGTFVYDDTQTPNTLIEFTNSLASLDVQPGDVLLVARTYTAGGAPTPVDVNHVVVQFGGASRRANG